MSDQHGRFNQQIRSDQVSYATMISLARVHPSQESQLTTSPADLPLVFIRVKAWCPKHDEEENTGYMANWRMMAVLDAQLTVFRSELPTDVGDQYDAIVAETVAVAMQHRARGGQDEH